MRTKLIATLIVLVLCLPLLASAQSSRSGEGSRANLDAKMASGKMNPFFEVDYGVATPKFKGMDGSFASLGVLEIKMGYSGRDSVTANVVAMEDRYIFGSYFGDDISPSGSAEAGEDLSRLSRFGFGDRMGFGYDFGGTSLDLYNQNSFNWTSVRAGDYDSASPDAQAIFDRYGTQFRFGQLVEAGAKFHLSRKVAITGGVEGSVIFPRYVFWPWLGSVAIYSVVEGGIEIFADRIMESSPTLGPIMAFLLKNGVSLGYYMLLRDDMAWPFDYEQPLTVESYKLGATLTF